MSRPLESFEFLNRSWDIRLLESQSIRTVFVILLMDLFMLGMLTIMTIYDLVHFHSFNWSNGMLLLVFILPAFRYSRLIYRRLGA